MSRAVLIAGAAAFTIGLAAVVAEGTGLMGGPSGDPSSAGLLAAEVRLAPGAVSGSPAQDSPAVKILGDAVDCPPAGAGPEDTQQRFEQQGSAVRVTGALTSFDGLSVVVAGPSGEVRAALAPQFELRGDLSPGSMVDVEATAAADGVITAHRVQSACGSVGVIDCATGAAPHFELRIAGTTFEVTGRLEDMTSDAVRVIGPGLVVEISRDGSTQVEGGLVNGDPVKVEGTVLDNQQLRALAVELRCEEAVAATPGPASPSTTAQAAVEAEAVTGQDCERGARGRGALRFERDDGEAEIKRGAVISSDGNSITVETPAGPVIVLTDEDTKVKGNLGSAVEVRVNGETQDGTSVLAGEIKVLCPAGNVSDNDNKDKNDDEDEGKTEEAVEGDDD